MQKFKAVIFDMDGTIIDTEKLWTRANHIFLEKKGILNGAQIIEENKHLFHGSTTKKIAGILKEITNIESSIEDIIKEKTQIAIELHEKDLNFIEGFIDFHNQLKKLNIPTAIATNAEPEGLSRVNKILKLEQYLGKHMYDIGCVEYIGKPLPDIYLHAADMLKIKPESCIAIEDSIHGICAAKAALMFTIGINTANIRSKLEEHADLTIEKYNEILLERFF